MITCVDIQCPACQQMKPSLTRWRNLGEIMLFVCNECASLDRNFCDEELLRIGFHHGWNKMESNLDKIMGQIKIPSDLGSLKKVPP